MILCIKCLFAVIFRVYCADHTYCTLRFSMNTTAEIIKACASEKLQLNRAPEDLLLVEIKSNGEKTIFKDYDVSIPTALCLNGRIFVSPKDHIDALVSERWWKMTVELAISGCYPQSSIVFCMTWLNICGIIVYFFWVIGSAAIYLSKIFFSSKFWFHVYACGQPEIFGRTSGMPT